MAGRTLPGVRIACRKSLLRDDVGAIASPEELPSRSIAVKFVLYSLVQNDPVIQNTLVLLDRLIRVPRFGQQSHT